MDGDELFSVPSCERKSGLISLYGGWNRTRSDERRRLAYASLGPMFVVDELDIVPFAEEVTLEEALMVDREDLPPLPKMQAEVSRSPFREMFEYFQVVELNGLTNVVCFEFVDMKDILHGRKIVDAKWIYSCKIDEFGSFGKAKSKMIAKGFAQV